MGQPDKRQAAGNVAMGKVTVGHPADKAPLHADGPFSRLSPRSLVRRFVPFAAGTPIAFGSGQTSERPAPTAGWLPGMRLPGFGPVDPFAEALGRLGDLEVRLARAAAEIRKAQAIRYHVFYEEMSAIADALTLATRRDVDAFDRICDHMLVLDHAAPPKAFRRRKPEVVGTYRLLRQAVAEANGGFYSAGEFDVGAVIDRHPGLSFLELGRSCVLPPYRNKRTVELLWHGIWSYVLTHRVDVMIGCASLEGTDPDRLAVPLSFLHHHARAPDEWRVSALPERRVEMNRLAKEAIDPKAALHALPPLIKGYLRLGAYIGEGAVVDLQFGTTDVMIVMPVAALNPRYVTYYGADASRHAG